MEEFGTRLRYYRRRRRLTQSQLAQQVGVAAAYISQIESALRVPSLKVARKFAAALGVELPTLLGSETPATQTDEMTDAQKLEVLQRLIRSVEFDQEHRPNQVDLENYWGSPGILLSHEDHWAVRMYRFTDQDIDIPDTFHFHPGREMLYCAAGRVHAMINGVKNTIVAGEVFQFDSSQPHLVWGDSGSLVISTATPALTRDNYEMGPADWTDAHPMFQRDSGLRNGAA